MNARQSVCHNIEFPMNMSYVSGKFRYEGQVSGLSGRFVTFALNCRRERFVVSVQSEGSSIKEILKVFDCAIGSQKFTVESAVVFLCIFIYL